MVRGARPSEEERGRFCRRSGLAFEESRRSTRTRLLRNDEKAKVRVKEKKSHSERRSKVANTMSLADERDSATKAETLSEEKESSPIVVSYPTQALLTSDPKQASPPPQLSVRTPPHHPVPINHFPDRDRLRREVVRLRRRRDPALPALERREKPRVEEVRDVRVEPAGGDDVVERAGAETGGEDGEEGGEVGGDEGVRGTVTDEDFDGEADEGRERGEGEERNEEGEVDLGILTPDLQTELAQTRRDEVLELLYGRRLEEGEVEVGDGGDVEVGGEGLEDEGRVGRRNLARSQLEVRRRRPDLWTSVRTVAGDGSDVRVGETKGLELGKEGENEAKEIGWIPSRRRFAQFEMLDRGRDCSGERCEEGGNERRGVAKDEGVEVWEEDEETTEVARKRGHGRKAEGDVDDCPLHVADRLRIDQNRFETLSVRDRGQRDSEVPLS